MKLSELREIIREEYQKLNEAKFLDSNFLMRTLDAMISDMKRFEPNTAKLFKHLYDRINQSYPDGDVTKNNVIDLLKEPSARSLVKKTEKEGFKSYYDIVDFIFDQ